LLEHYRECAEDEGELFGTDEEEGDVEVEQEVEEEGQEDVVAIAEKDEEMLPDPASISLPDSTDRGSVGENISAAGERTSPNPRSRTSSPDKQAPVRDGKHAEEVPEGDAIIESFEEVPAHLSEPEDDMDSNSSEEAVEGDHFVTSPKATASPISLFENGNLPELLSTDKVGSLATAEPNLTVNMSMIVETGSSSSDTISGEDVAIATSTITTMPGPQPIVVPASSTSPSTATPISLTSSSMSVSTVPESSTALTSQDAIRPESRLSYTSTLSQGTTLAPDSGLFELLRTHNYAINETRSDVRKLQRSFAELRATLLGNLQGDTGEQERQRLARQEERERMFQEAMKKAEEAWNRAQDAWVASNANAVRMDLYDNRLGHVDDRLSQVEERLDRLERAGDRTPTPAHREPPRSRSTPPGALSQGPTSSTNRDGSYEFTVRFRPSAD